VTSDRPLRILHAVRAPVGGIFRHIMDLANGQADRGHEVGIIADSLTGGDRAEAALAEIRTPPQARRSSSRHSPRTVSHGPAGMGAFHAPDPAAQTGCPARARRQGRRLHPVKTPFQGHHSRLHAAWRFAALNPLNTLKGAIYSRLERALMNSTDLSCSRACLRDTYQRTIGIPHGLVRCVFKWCDRRRKFDPVARAADATDVVYVGEFRQIKARDLLIDAVARLRADGKPVTLTLAGDGEELDALKAQIQKLVLAKRCVSSVMSRARYGFSRATCWWFRRAGIRCPMW